MSKPLMNYEVGVVNADGTLGAHSDGIATATLAETGLYDITFKSGLFSQPPVIVATPYNKGETSIGVPLVSTSSFTVSIEGQPEGPADAPFSFLVVPVS